MEIVSLIKWLMPHITLICTKTYMKSSLFAQTSSTSLKITLQRQETRTAYPINFMGNCRTLEREWQHFCINSGNVVRVRSRQQPLWGIHRTETDAAGDVPNTTRIENNREKQSTQYLTRFDNVPTSSGQGRERSYWFNNQLQLIPSSRNFRERFSEGFLGIQYMRALALIYSHRVPGV